MKESTTLLHAFDQLCSEQKPCALATVVRVAGSSYRRPGARMLVAADGRTWGGVSGGCLERDVARRARNVIDTSTPVLRSFDTTDDFGDGAALGCAGMIDILIEPLSAQSPGPFPALRRAIVDRVPTSVATLIDANPNAAALATRYHCGNAKLPASILELLEGAYMGVSSCDGADVFFERLRPPQSLVLFGGGPDVVPVVSLAKTLGWHVSVIAGHAAIGYRERFSLADQASIGNDEDPFGGISIEPHSAVVLMTHNYARDLLLLPLLLTMQLDYLGILGPRRRAERLVLESPHIAPEAVRQLHAPVGLDLGAETPEAIALSIVAEIQAVLFSRPCTSLRDRRGPIYPRDAAMTETAYHPVACPISA